MLSRRLFEWIEENRFPIAIVYFLLLLIVGLSGLFLLILVVIIEEYYDFGYLLQIFSLTSVISISFLIFTLDKYYDQKEIIRKESAILSVFKNEIIENQYQLNNMLRDYKEALNLKEVKASNVVYYRDLSLILSERVLNFVNPETTKCHLIIERLRSTLSTINNFNATLRNLNNRISHSDIQTTQNLIKQAMDLNEIVMKKLGFGDLKIYVA